MGGQILLDKNDMIYNVRCSFGGSVLALLVDEIWQVGFSYFAGPKRQRASLQMAQNQFFKSPIQFYGTGILKSHSGFLLEGNEMPAEYRNSGSQPSQ